MFHRCLRFSNFSATPRDLDERGSGQATGMERKAKVAGMYDISPRHPPCMVRRECKHPRFHFSRRSNPVPSRGPLVRCIDNCPPVSLCNAVSIGYLHEQASQVDFQHMHLPCPFSSLMCRALCQFQNCNFRKTCVGIDFYTNRHQSCRSCGS